MAQPKFELLTAFDLPLGSQAFQDEIQRLQDKKECCNGCVDAAFTGKWLTACSGLQAERAHNDGRSMLAVLPISSVAVEMKHLLGQDVLHKRRRGRSLHPQTLAKRTYRKVVALHCENRSKAALRSVLGSYGR